MTKFVMDVKELAEAVGIIQPCTAATGSVMKFAILNRKRNDGNIVMLSCYDGKKQIVTFATAYETEMEQEDMEVCLDGKKFSSLALLLGQRGSKVRFTIDKNMVVDDGNSNVTFALLDAAPFLENEQNILYQFNLKTTDLRSMLQNGGFAYINDKGQVKLRNIALKFDRAAGKITCCSSNGPLIAIDECVNVKYMDTEYPETSYVQLIEGNQMKSVMRMLKAEYTTFYVTGPQLNIKNGMNLCQIHATDDTYPIEAIQKMLKEQKRKCGIVVSVAELMNAIDIFQIANGGELPFCIMKDAGANKISIQTKQGDGTDIVVKKQGSFGEIAFNGYLFKDVISNYDKNAEIFLGIGEPLEAIVVKKQENAMGVSFLMPLKGME